MFHQKELKMGTFNDSSIKENGENRKNMDFW